MLFDENDRILEILSELNFSGLIQASIPRDTQHERERAQYSPNFWGMEELATQMPPCRVVRSQARFAFEGPEDHIPTVGLIILSQACGCTIEINGKLK